jgi:hypothetical protein
VVALSSAHWLVQARMKVCFLERFPGKQHSHSFSFPHFTSRNVPQIEHAPTPTRTHTHTHAYTHQQQQHTHIHTHTRTHINNTHTHTHTDRHTHIHSMSVFRKVGILLATVVLTLAIGRALLGRYHVVCGPGSREHVSVNVGLSSCLSSCVTATRGTHVCAPAFLSAHCIA